MCRLWHVGTSCHLKNTYRTEPADSLDRELRKSKELAGAPKTGNGKEGGPQAFRFAAQGFYPCLDHLGSVSIKQPPLGRYLVCLEPSNFSQ